MARNYPLVLTTNQGTKHVFYARAHDHSTMGIATGNTIVSTTRTLLISAAGLISCPGQAGQVARESWRGVNGVIVQSKFGGQKRRAMRIRRKTSLQFAALRRKGHRLLYAEKEEDTSCSR